MVTRIPPKVLRAGNHVVGAEPSLIAQQIFPPHVNSMWKTNPLSNRVISTITPLARKTIVTIEDFLPSLPPNPPLPRFLMKRK